MKIPSSEVGIYDSVGGVFEVSRYSVYDSPGAFCAEYEATSPARSP